MVNNFTLLRGKHIRVLISLVLPHHLLISFAILEIDLDETFWYIEMFICHLFPDLYN